MQRVELWQVVHSDSEETKIRKKRDGMDGWRRTTTIRHGGK
jgi:hypothetical protein